MSTEAELEEFITELADQTRSGSLVWQKTNLNLFTWRKVSKDGSGTSLTTITSIQRAASPRGGNDYLLTVSTQQNANPAKVRVVLSSAERRELAFSLEMLFDAAELNADAQTLKLLKKLLT